MEPAGPFELIFTLIGGVAGGAVAFYLILRALLRALERALERLGAAEEARRRRDFAAAVEAEKARRGRGPRVR